jgi:hypothetical protein
VTTEPVSEGGHVSCFRCLEGCHVSCEHVSLQKTVSVREEAVR